MITGLIWAESFTMNDLKSKINTAIDLGYKLLNIQPLGMYYRAYLIMEDKSK